MKADCPNCAHYSPHPCPPTNGADGFCERLSREVYDVESRNCDGFGFLAKSFEVDAGDNGTRYYIDAAMNDKGRVTHG